MTAVELTMRSANESVLKDLVPTDGEWFNQTQEEEIRIHVTQHSSLRYYIANKALQNTAEKGPQHLRVRSHWRLSKATAKVLLWCFPSFWVNVLFKLWKDTFANNVAFAFAFAQCEQALKHYSHISLMPNVAKQKTTYSLSTFSGVLIIYVRVSPLSPDLLSKRVWISVNWSL